MIFTLAATISSLVYHTSEVLLFVQLQQALFELHAKTCCPNQKPFKHSMVFYRKHPKHQKKPLLESFDFLMPVLRPIQMG